jgi:hypothetical protein
VDVNGRRSIDFMCAWGPNYLGYRHPEVEEAVQRQPKAGDCLNGPVRISLTSTQGSTVRIPSAPPGSPRKRGWTLRGTFFTATMFRRPGIRIWEMATFDGNGDHPRVENQGGTVLGIACFSCLTSLFYRPTKTALRRPRESALAAPVGVMQQRIRAPATAP